MMIFDFMLDGNTRMDIQAIVNRLDWSRSLDYKLDQDTQMSTTHYEFVKISRAIPSKYPLVRFFIP